jgi:hypothetical protein
MNETIPENHMHSKHLRGIHKAIAEVEKLGRAWEKDNNQRRLATTWREYDEYSAYRN